MCVCVLTHVQAASEGSSVNMENYFSRLALDIIGKAVFNYDFDSLMHDDPVIEVRLPCFCFSLNSCSFWRWASWARR